MSVNKISDTELDTQNRYHVNQDDVPKKSAQDMKEFMDYIPRQVIIPKINEIVDEVDTKADIGDSYTKSEADALLLQKAADNNVYKKSETYNKSETDSALSAKANSADVYTKTECDSSFSGKANVADVYTKAEVYSKTEADTEFALKADSTGVYTKTEADSMLALKADKNSKYAVREITSTDGMSEPGVYNVNGVQYIYTNGTDIVQAIPEVGDIVTTINFNGIQSELTAHPESGDLITVNIAGYGSFTHSLNYVVDGYYISMPYASVYVGAASPSVIDDESNVTPEGYTVGQITVTSITELGKKYLTVQKVLSQYIKDQIATVNGKSAVRCVGSEADVTEPGIYNVDGVQCLYNDEPTVVQAVPKAGDTVTTINFNGTQSELAASPESGNLITVNIGGYGSFTHSLSYNVDGYYITMPYESVCLGSVSSAVIDDESNVTPEGYTVGQITVTSITELGKKYLTVDTAADHLTDKIASRSYVDSEIAKLKAQIQSLL